MKAKMVMPNLKATDTHTPSRPPVHINSRANNPSNFACAFRGVVGENDNCNKYSQNAVS